MGKIFCVDLGSGRIKGEKGFQKVSELYLSGFGLATRYLYHMFQRKQIPLTWRIYRLVNPFPIWYACALGVGEFRWAPRSSKPVTGRSASRGGFDSHPFPPFPWSSCDTIHH